MLGRVYFQGALMKMTRRFDGEQLGAMIAKAALAGVSLAAVSCGAKSPQPYVPASTTTGDATKDATVRPDIHWTELDEVPTVGECRTPGQGESMQWGDWVARCCTAALCNPADAEGKCGATVSMKNLASESGNEDKILYGRPKEAYQPAGADDGSNPPEKPCCYVTEVCTTSGVMFGRPLFVRGESRLSGVTRRADWGAVSLDGSVSLA
jgi:hypothetical protein